MEMARRGDTAVVSRVFGSAAWRSCKLCMRAERCEGAGSAAELAPFSPAKCVRLDGARRKASLFPGLDVHRAYMTRLAAF